MGASVTSILALSSMAGQPAESDIKDNQTSQNRLTREERANRLNGASKASDIIGKTVINYQDVTLGEVKDIAVDVESGRIIQVILSTGGFVEEGDIVQAVPSELLHHDVKLDVVHLDSDVAKLKNAPRFEMDNWAASSDNNKVNDVYRYHGSEPEFDQNPSIPAERMKDIQQVSKLLGMPVKNLQDEKLGDVDNILLDLPSGRIVAVVITSGGFLGIGDELSAIPSTALRFTSDRTALQLDATKDMLSSTPHFNSKQWPDFAQPEYAGGVHRAYNVEPYFTTNAAVGADNSARNDRDRNDRALTTRDQDSNKADADNTARNDRDRDERTLTPLDQGNNQADVDITAQIRKEIIDGENMSINARNIKIITIDGQVTLRGPVDTIDEKNVIGEIANRIASAGNVDNQLEVTLKTTQN